MKRCSKCGKISILKKINSDGLCGDCEQNARANTYYFELCNAYENRNNGTFDEKIKHYNNILKIIDDIKQDPKIEKMVVDKIFTNSEKTSHFYAYNKIFGTMGFDDDILNKICESTQNGKNEFVFKLKKQTEFSDEINAIPMCKIVENQCAEKKRKFLKDFPDVKIAPITANTSRDSIISHIVIDTETTGLTASHDRIIEIAAIKFLEFKPIEIFHTLINPGDGFEIPESATKINGITNEMVIDAPQFCEIREQFQKFISDDFPIVGHNIVFDLKFLHVNGIDLFSKKRKFYDTMVLSKKIHTSKYDSHSLDVLCDNAGIVRRDKHRAVDDCFATSILFEKYVNYIAG